MDKKYYIDCCGRTKNETGMFANIFANMLEEKGYRYGYNGSPCERRAASNMPFITIDTATGFYWGSKGADISINWTKFTDDVLRRMSRILPNIEHIYQRNKKSDGPVDNHTRQPSKDGRKMERFWYTVTGRMMPISSMNDDHLHNTILMVDRAIADGYDTISNNQDLANLLDELEDERIHRGLHLPLIPYKSLKYRKGNQK